MDVARGRRIERLLTNLELVVITTIRTPYVSHLCVESLVSLSLFRGIRTDVDIEDLNPFQKDRLPFFLPDAPLLHLSDVHDSSDIRDFIDYLHMAGCVGNDPT